MHDCDTIIAARQKSRVDDYNTLRLIAYELAGWIRCEKMPAFEPLYPEGSEENKKAKQAKFQREYDAYMSSIKNNPNIKVRYE